MAIAQSFTSKTLPKALRSRRLISQLVDPNYIAPALNVSMGQSGLVAPLSNVAIGQSGIIAPASNIAQGTLRSGIIAPAESLATGPARAAIGNVPSSVAAL